MWGRDALPEKPGKARAETALVAAGLCALVLAVYWGVARFGLVSLDDPRYLLENPWVRRGLTGPGVAWAFTATWAANWHPLTWLSLMLDVELFGLDPGWLHGVNVLWHAANAAGLFLVLRLATGSTWRSALVAALFGVHPLHVESVAWIAERKDVLSTFFWILAMGAWVGYARRPGAARYALVAGACALGLLAKPMLVTLPVVLLLLDLWPLGRAELSRPIRSWAPLVIEKIPLLALSAASSAITILAQSQSGAVAAATRLAFPARVANALTSYAWYLGKAIWPSGLSAFYPHPALGPSGISPWRVAASVVLLAAGSALALRQRGARPYLLVGWAWYLVTLLPVIGLVQVGRQGMADRYSYVPLIGIFLAVAWALPAAPARWRAAWAGAAAALLAALALVARTQVGTWRDSETLFSHATAVDRDNWLAWANLGLLHFDRGEIDEAERAFREAVRSAPWDSDAWANLAACHAARAEWGRAAELLERTVQLAPGDGDSWSNLAVAYQRSGRPDRALATVERLRSLDPARAARTAERLRGP